MLLSKGKITPDLITLLRSWWHSGFQVYAGPRIQPGEEEGKDDLDLEIDNLETPEKYPLKSKPTKYLPSLSNRRAVASR